ncbi:NAD-dependent epimerase/dehydratase family protein [Segetibacter aerophilus]|uniref:CDP-abequose synthase n=1 Tax=Segetibacter aerophilus TaxID=670293 RepID=A0A512BI09_9BACT|nr:NAD(P)-dependent oxidoreductase [Segetibacter aerophilus]GEO11616.1 CDP-abequose synthase [Segetibacter aerophilus]
MSKVLISGVSGFLGSYIAERLLRDGNEVIGLKRSTSNLFRCENFVEQVVWINVDETNWKQQVLKLGPDIIIHSAWSGVSADKRVAWKEQLSNLEMVLDLLELGAELKISKFMGLGSQAEYGTFSGKVDESYSANPNTAYGAVKLMASTLAKSFCEASNINWYWLRLFPMFGEKEDQNWLIPSVIKSILDKKSMDLTPGMQKYAYLYVKDFAEYVAILIGKNLSSTAAGVYNISSDRAITLKELIEKIRDRIDASVTLNFGALPYRSYQSMHLEGDMSKFNSTIERIKLTDFDKALYQTIDYYINKAHH